MVLQGLLQKGDEEEDEYEKGDEEEDEAENEKPE